MSDVPPRSPASHGALPPEGVAADLGRPGVGGLPPRSPASHGALPPEGPPTRNGSASARSVWRML